MNDLDLGPSSRVLTRLERGFALSHLKRELRLQRVLVVSGAMIICLGVATPFVVLLERGSISGGWMWFLGLYAVFCVLSGAKLVRTMAKRKLHLYSEAYVARGVLRELAMRAGGVSIPQYRIGDVRIIWPPGSDSVVIPWSGKYIELVVAIVERSNYLQLFGDDSACDEVGHDAVVLEFDNFISIDAAIRKYGHRMFFWRRFKLFMSLVFVALGLFALSSRETLPENVGVEVSWIMIVSMLVQILLLGVVSAVLPTFFESVFVKLGAPIDTTPYEQKLKG